MQSKQVLDPERVRKIEGRSAGSTTASSREGFCGSLEGGGKGGIEDPHTNKKERANYVLHTLESDP